MSQDELIDFYKDEMVQLKDQLNQKLQVIADQQDELNKCLNLINSLKENNEGLSDMFSQYKTFAQLQMTELEQRLAQMSVEKADKDFQLDQLLYEIKQMKKKEQQEEKYESPPDNVSSTDLEDQQTKVKMSAEIYNMSPEDFQQVKKSNKQYLSLFDQIKQNKKKKKQEIEILMDNLPTSVYKILYEDEIKKIKDTSNKQFEMKIWQDEVMCLFVNKVKNRKRIKEKLDLYVKNSFPEQFRGKIWSFLIGNNQKINKNVYDKFLKVVPQNPMVTQQLLTQINNDLTRTFSIINEFEDSGRLQDEMREVLIIFSMYRPDFGYVQGMTYLVFMFLIRMNKQKAFKCFSNLVLGSDLLRNLYLFKGKIIDKYFNAFDTYILQYLPKVAKHLDDLKIPKQSFLVEWYYTVFTRAFNLIISSKVWDHFLCEGDGFIFKISLSILSTIQNDIIQSEYEDCLMLIRNCSFQLKDSDIFKTNRYKITTQSLQDLFLSQMEN